LLPPLTSDAAITNTTITSGQGMVHPNYTSGSDPSEEHNDISQTMLFTRAISGFDCQSLLGSTLGGIFRLLNNGEV
jgi:hypothetical protein